MSDVVLFMSDVVSAPRDEMQSKAPGPAWDLGLSSKTA